MTVKANNVQGREQLVQAGLRQRPDPHAVHVVVGQHDRRSGGGHTAYQPDELCM